MILKKYSKKDVLGEACNEQICIANTLCSTTAVSQWCVLMVFYTGICQYSQRCFPFSVEPPKHFQSTYSKQGRANKYKSRTPSMHALDRQLLQPFA